jgi:hypothetical protein
MIGIGLVASANLGWAFLFNERIDEPVTPSSSAAAQSQVPQVYSQTKVQRDFVQSVERGQSDLRATEARVVSRASAARPAYTVPTDAAESARRFLGAEAQAIAMQWRDEPTSAEAEPTQHEIAETYASADALASVRNIECRTTLCRIQLDRKLATEDHAVVKRRAGKLGAIGWIQRASATTDDLVVFIPIDFNPM